MEVDDDDDIQILEYPPDSSFTNWASLVAEQAGGGEDNGDSEEEDVENDLLNLGDGSDSESFLLGVRNRQKEETPKPTLDREKFQQMLNLMVQQATTLDRLRTELKLLKEQQRRERDDRDLQQQQAQSQLKRYLSERDEAVSTREKALAEVAALKTRLDNGLPVSDARMLSLDEHRRIVQRVETEAKNRVAITEAEKSELVLQISKLRIELIQATNESTDDQYPSHVMDALSERLREEMDKSCQSIIAKKSETMKALTSAEKEIAEMDSELARANSALLEEENRSTQLANELDDLHETLTLVGEQRAHIEGDKIRLEQKLHGYEERLAETVEELNSVRLHRDELLEQLSEAEVLKDEAEAERDRLKQDLQTVTEERNMLMTDLTESQALRDEAIAERQRLNDDAISVTAYREELLVRLEQAELQRDDALSKLLEKETIRQETLSQPSDAVVIPAIEGDLADMASGESESSTKSELQQLQVRYIEVISERDQLQDAKSALETQIQTLRSEHALSEHGMNEDIALEGNKHLEAVQELEVRIRELQTELSEVKSQLGTATLDLTKKSEMIQQLESDAKDLLDDFKAQLSNAQAERDKALLEWNQTSEVSKKLQETLTQSEEDLNAVRLERDTLVIELNRQEGEHETLEKQVSESTAAITDIRNERDKALQEQERLISFKQDLEAKLANAEASLASVKVDLADALQEQARLTEVNRNLEAKSHQVMAELQSTKIQHDEVVQSLRSQLSSVQSERESDALENRKLTEKLDAATRQASDLQSDKTKVLKELDTVKAEVTIAQKTADAKVAELEARHAAVLAEKKSLQQNANSLEMRLAQTHKDVQLASEERDQAIERSKLLQESVSIAEQKQDDAQKNLITSTTTIEELQKSMTSRQEELKKSTAQINKLQTKLDDLEAEHVDAIQEIERWKKLASEHATRCDENEKTTDELQGKYGALVTRHKVLKNRFERIKVGQMKSHRRIRQMKKALKDAERRLDNVLSKTEETESLLQETRRKYDEALARRTEINTADEQHLSEENQRLKGELEQLQAKFSNSEKLVTDLVLSTSKDKRALDKYKARVSKLENARARMAMIYSGKHPTSPDRGPINLGTPLSSPPPATEPSSSRGVKRQRLGEHGRTASEVTEIIDTDVEEILTPISPAYSLTFESSLDTPVKLPSSSSSYSARSSRGILQYEQQQSITPWSQKPSKQPDRPWVANFVRKLVKVVTWPRGERGGSRCGFCQLEKSAGRTGIQTDLPFDPSIDAEMFWQHIKTAHFAYIRPELLNMDFLTGKDRSEIPGSKSSSPEVQEIVSPAPKRTGKDASPTPASAANVSDVDKRARMREVYFRLAFLSSRQPNARYSGYYCSFCILEHLNSERPVPGLSFNPQTEWEAFWIHCRTKHAPIWKPSIKERQLVPQEVIDELVL